MSALVSAWLLGLCLAQTPAERPGPPPNGESHALLFGLTQSGVLEFSAPEGPARVAAQVLAKRVTAGRELTARVLAEGAAPDPRAVRLLLGSPAEPTLAALARVAGIEASEHGFRAFGRAYEAPGDAAVLTFEDPAHPGRPCALYLGNDLSELAVYVDQVPRLSRPFLTLYADGELALTCPLARDGHPLEEGARDYLARREQYFAGGPRRTIGAITLVAHGEPEEGLWREYSKALAGAQKRTLDWLALTPESEAPEVELYLYEHPEDFEWCLGTSELSLVSRLRARAHVLLAPGLPNDGGQALARLCARELAGAPAEAWLADGLAVAASGQWWGRPLNAWIGHLALGRNLPDLREFLLPGADAHLSPHVLQPLRGFVLQLLVQGTKGDARALRALWKGADLQPKRLSVAFQKAVIKAAKSVGKEGGPAAARILKQRVLGAPVRHGLALVEGPEAGYGSRATGGALDEAMRLGSGPDAVALSVLVMDEDPCAPTAALRGTPLFADTSDVALATAVAAARGRGARVLLSLEVLAEASGSWVDTISWTRPTDMNEFVARLSRLTLHYALLAELLEIEVLSLAGNLRDGARTAPLTEVLDPHRQRALENGWKTVIARLRSAYRGGLTYTSRFPSDAQEVGFFGALDFLSVALFPRMAAGKVPSDLELERLIRFELEKALDLAVRWNKPLLLTQVGYPARSDSWDRPAVPRGEADAAAQQRWIEALARVLEGRLENGVVLRGWYLWNWPLDEARARAEDDGFSLRNKPASAALTRLFTR